MPHKPSPHKRRRRPRRPPAPPSCLSVEQFCEGHGISKAHFYRLRAQGLTPTEFKLGARTLITQESAEAWRRERSQPGKRNPATAIPAVI
jgi:predicted DNA-binding transcriptional regulator AlpA